MNQEKEEIHIVKETSPSGKQVLIALTSAAVIAGVAGCGTSSTSTATPTSSRSASAGATTPGQPAPAPGAQSACRDLGGTVAADQTCHFHTDTASYTLDFRFPVDYPDQQPPTDFLTQQRDGFVAWVAQQPAGARSHPDELDITSKAYHSSGTQSLVFDVGEDTGVHPVTTYKAFNYDLSKHSPITFDTLFKPGTEPLEVLNPIVQRGLDKRGTAGPVSLNDLGVKAYQNFAITDDAVIFFFNQDGLLSHENGPLQVSVPRTEIAALLA